MRRFRPAEPGGETVTAAFAAAAEAHPEKTALTFLKNGLSPAITLTYSELYRDVCAIAAGLQQRAAAGSRVLLLLAPGPDYVAGLLGAIEAGQIPVPLFAPTAGHRLDRLATIAADCTPTLALVDPADMTRAREQLGAGLNEMALVAIDDLRRSGASVQRHASRADDLAFLQYTSGSTAAPKGIRVRHANLIADVIAINRRYQFDADCATIVWLPPYHDLGLLGGIFVPLLSAARTVLMPPESFLARPWRWLQAISHYSEGARVYAGGPNFAYDVCVDRVADEQLAGVDLSSWYVAFNGAEPVQARTLARFRERFGPFGFDENTFFACYGMAEATLMISGPTPRTPIPGRTLDRAALARNRVEPAVAGAPSVTVVGCGHVVDDHQLAVVDPESGEPVDPGKIGELWFSGPSVADGYWQKPELTQTQFKGQVAGYPDRLFLRTGDLGFVEDGEIYITGRLKDVIIIDGSNIYPNDIEQVVHLDLAGHPMHMVAAFATEAAGGRPSLTLLVEWGRTGHESISAALARARTSVGREIGVPIDEVGVVQRGAIPVTSSGKVRRSAARAAYKAGTLTPFWIWSRGGVASAIPVVSRAMENVDGA